MLRWGVGSGAVLGCSCSRWRPVLPRLFSADPGVRSALTATLVVVALAQPLSGWVFVLDGVLIGAGDGRYLAVAGAVTLVAYLPLCAACCSRRVRHGGLVALWVAFAFGFMLVRAVTLGLRRARRGVAGRRRGALTTAPARWGGRAAR
jgi:Na+-driven multidrug efflux pump